MAVVDTFESALRLDSLQAEALRERLTSGALSPQDEELHRDVIDVTLGDEESESEQTVTPERFTRLRSRAPRQVGDIESVLEVRDAFVIQMVLEEEPERFRLATYSIPKRRYEDWWSDIEGDLDWTSVPAVASPKGPLPAPVATATELVGASMAADKTRNAWRALSTLDAPEPRELHAAVWTGTHMIIWGGIDGNCCSAQDHLDTGARYDPALDTWTPTSTGPSARRGPMAVWTGSVMIIWGGQDHLGTLNTGSRYDPITDSWTPTSLVNSPPPLPRFPVVWTGTEMIIWGASSSRRYDPVADVWSAISLVNAPFNNPHTAVWSGREMIVWGYDPTGGRYDPALDIWRPISTINAPSRRDHHTAIWSGREMIVWGGHTCCPETLVNTGGRYDPVADVWRDTASNGSVPSKRIEHTAVWSGTRMIVWGGVHASFTRFLDTGGEYDPATDKWQALTTTNAPTPRRGHTAVWADDGMIIWGGSDSRAFWAPVGGTSLGEPARSPIGPHRGRRGPWKTPSLIAAHGVEPAALRGGSSPLDCRCPRSVTDGADRISHIGTPPHVSYLGEVGR